MDSPTDKLPEPTYGELETHTGSYLTYADWEATLGASYDSLRYEPEPEEHHNA